MIAPISSSVALRLGFTNPDASSMPTPFGFLRILAYLLAPVLQEKGLREKRRGPSVAPFTATRMQLWLTTTLGLGSGALLGYVGA